jgi:DNA mismatch repair protein MutL
MNSQLPILPSIHVLPDQVASKIAAGEVVERPSSVVRELIDNSIDSGALHVRVEIRGGGRELIRVLDDGCGIAPDGLPTAFLRHATSKISTAEDLWAIRTLGFRGEALFSIAAVSRLTLASRPRSSSAGLEISLEGGKQVAEAVRGMPAGTVVSVRDLFFNLPARLKFLKSAPAEAAHIAALVQQYAMAYPHIRFTLVNEGRTTFQSPGTGDLREAGTSVYGADVSRVLLPVGLEPEDIHALPGNEEMYVYGYASPPTVSRSNRGAMHFYVNHRAVHSKMLQFAVQEAYHSLLMVGRFPICILNVVLDPVLVDVNVHPAKAEVKFRDERATFSAAQRAVRSALTAHTPAPAYGSRGAEGWLFPEDNGTAVFPANGQAPAAGEWSRPGPAQSDLWPASTGGHHEVEPLPAPPPRTLPPLRVVGQIGNTYVIAEGPDGLFLIDQHAAHERVLYEKLAADIERGALTVQPLLQPVPLELTSRQRSDVEQLLPFLAPMGFEFESFGDSALLVRAVPAVYAGAQRDLGHDLLEMIDQVLNGAMPERWREELLITLACHSAVRAGKNLSLDEMRSLLEQLEVCRYPGSCAHGRPTMLHLTQTQLEREFGRRG